LKARQLVVQAVAGGEKEHRGRDAVRTQPLHGTQAVEARHHDVHDDDVEALLGQQLQRGWP
jgi:hypothetical protein